MPRAPRPGTAVSALAVAIGYFALSVAGLTLIEPALHVAVLWPASGFALAVFATSDRRRWPALTGAVFAANLAAQWYARDLAWYGLGLAAANALEPLLAAWVLQRVAGTHELSFIRLRTVVGLLAAATAANAVTALIGAGTLVAAVGAPLLTSWATWWLADGLGMLIVVPVALAFSRSGGGPRRRVESIAAVVTAALVTALVFGSDAQSPPILQDAFLLFPVLLWAAMRASGRALAAVLAIVGVGGAYATAAGSGPFARLEFEPAATVLVCQAFMAVAMTSTLVVAAAWHERRSAMRAMATERERFSSVLRAATEYSVIATDLDGTITVFNEGAERMLGYTAAEVVGHATPELIHLPHEVAEHAQAVGTEPGFAAFVSEALAGRAETREWTYQRKDGSLLPVTLTVTAVRSDDGTPTGFIGIAEDISARRAAETALHEERRLLNESQAVAHVGSWEIDLATGRPTWSAEQFRLYGMDPADEIPPFERYLDSVHPDDRSALAASTQANIEHPGAFVDEFRILHPTLGTRTLVVRGDHVPAEPGRPARVAGTTQDVTAERAAQADRDAADERFRRSFEDALIGMVTMDLDGRFDRVNDAFCAIVGRSRDQLEGAAEASITHPEDAEDTQEALRTLLDRERSGYHCEKRYIHATGHAVWVLMAVTLIRDREGRPLHCIAQVQDITERKDHERRLRHLADHDPLTGLLNRRRFLTELDRHVATCSRYGAAGALLVLDIDGFKQVNDTLGHSVGDELIVGVATILRERLRETDAVARLGGDEFAILLPRADGDATRAIAAALLDGVREHTSELSGDQRRTVTISVGIAPFTDRGPRAAEDMIIAADLAMYDAKRSGRDRYAFAGADADPAPSLTSR